MGKGGGTQAEDPEKEERLNFKVVETSLIAYPGIPQDKDVYSRLGGEFKWIPCQTEDELIAAACDADAVITGGQPYSQRVIENLEKCKIIQTMGIGYEGVDVGAATEHGICVCNVPDYCVEEVSDHAMALLLACARKLVCLVDAVRQGEWDTVQAHEVCTGLWPPMSHLREQTLGLIGLGKIPRALVPKAKGFGLRVIAHDPYVPSHVAEELGVEIVDLERLLKEADYVSLHAALTPWNRHMLGLEEFKKMRPTAYVINTARGGLIDEGGLSQALKEGRIAGAALDVLEQEPPHPDNPLLKSDRVILTAHSAHYSESSAAELKRRPEQNIFTLLRGEWPKDLVNPQVKEKFLARWGRRSWI